MSEPVAKPRYLGEHSNAFDLEEIERRMRESIEPQQPARDTDPLAELARLVGQTNNDAFSKIFDVPVGPASPPPVRGAAPSLSEPPPFSAPPRDRFYPAAYEPQPEPSAEAHPQHEDHYDPHSYGQQPAYAADGYAQPDQGWQEHGYQQQTTYQEYADVGYDEPPRRTGRAKLLIGAALLVIAGGGAGAYMLRGSNGFGKDAPTIMASSGPTKVQPAEQASDGPKPSISILERGAPGNAQGKVIQNEEQPVDVAATARASGMRPARGPDAGAPVTLAPPPPPPVANSIFAEPKRVKAVAVRPDGTIIDPNAPAAAPTPAPRAETPAPAPSTPAPAMAARPTDMASLLASTTPGSGAKPAARAEAKSESKPEPKPARKSVAAASAPATTASIPAPTGAGGGFSVQLAGTTSVQEARDAVERLSRKYASELGGYRPAVVKAEVGSKTVYRIRVKNLSSEEANTLCAKLKAGNGSCFVARD